MVIQKKIVEAILFSAPEAFSVQQIAKISDMDVGEAKKIIDELIEEYTARDTSIEIIELRGKYLMRIKPMYYPYVEKFVEKDLDRGSLRTLAVIALKQPLPLSKLAKIRGNKCYEHVRKLVDAGFVKAKPSGRTRILSTTKEFAIYFGLRSNNPEEIRNFLKKAAKTDSVLERYIEI
jgi:segregation and condensation protein B